MQSLQMAELFVSVYVCVLYTVCLNRELNLWFERCVDDKKKLCVLQLSFDEMENRSIIVLLCSLFSC
jgi:hypothetical protein